MRDLLGDRVLLVGVDDSRIASLAIDFKVEKRVTLARSENLAQVDFAYGNVQRFHTLTIIDGRDLTSLTQTGVVAVCT